MTSPLGDTSVVIVDNDVELAVFVRAYDDDFRRSFGALADGCDEVNVDSILGIDVTGRRRRKRQVPTECTQACAVVQDDVFQYGCEIDCTVTGDPEVNKKFKAPKNVCNMYFDHDVR